MRSSPMSPTGSSTRAEPSYPRPVIRDVLNAWATDPDTAVGPREGVPYPSVINCDNVLTIPRDALDPEPIGTLGSVKRQQLDRALRYSLAIKT